MRKWYGINVACMFMFVCVRERVLWIFSLESFMFQTAAFAKIKWVNILSCTGCLSWSFSTKSLHFPFIRYIFSENLFQFRFVDSDKEFTSYSYPKQYLFFTLCTNIPVYCFETNLSTSTFAVEVYLSNFEQTKYSIPLFLMSCVNLFSLYYIVLFGTFHIYSLTELINFQFCTHMLFFGIYLFGCEMFTNIECERKTLIYRKERLILLSLLLKHLYGFTHHIMENENDSFRI